MVDTEAPSPAILIVNMLLAAAHGDEESLDSSSARCRDCRVLVGMVFDGLCEALVVDGVSAVHSCLFFLCAGSSFHKQGHAKTTPEC